MNMEELTKKVDQLRYDLSAVLQAVACIQAVLPTEQQQQVLTAMEKASALKQELYDAPQATPEAQAKVRLAGAAMQASEERVYEMLHGASQLFRPDPSTKAG